jgi:hypothetical protein
MLSDHLWSIFCLWYCAKKHLFIEKYHKNNVHMVPWLSVHWRTDHVTIQTTLRPLNNPSAVTIRLCDMPTQSGWIVRPLKKQTLRPKNLDGLSCWDIKTHCNILSQSLWHFVHLFFVQLCCDILSQCNKRSIFPHFHMWQLILKGLCVSWMINHSSINRIKGPFFLT